MLTCAPKSMGARIYDTDAAGVRPVAVQGRPQAEWELGARKRSFGDALSVENREVRVVRDHIVEHGHEVTVAFGRIRSSRYEAGFLNDGLRPCPPHRLFAGAEIDVRDRIHDESRGAATGTFERLFSIGHQQPAMALRLRGVTIIDARELAE